MRAPGTQPIEELSLEGAEAAAFDRALDLLSVQDRTERGLRDRLATDGHSNDDIDDAVARLKELGLVDDLSFALEFVERRGRLKRLAPQGLIAELEAKGVTPEIARQAVEEAGIDEEAAAIEVASDLMARVAGLPPARQVGRIQSALARRGYSEEACEAALRAVLPPEGWD
ncbi:MAG: recombination regulator RecX [Actinomycetota bacterium]|nr:recombination regulator RecX [Actinomycetota bacterium]